MISGFSFGKYCGPGFCSRLFGCICASVSMRESSTYSWFCAYFRSTSAGLSVLVSLNWVVQKQGILVEVVLGLLLFHPWGQRERMFWCLKSVSYGIQTSSVLCLWSYFLVLDFVLVGVLRTWSKLSDVLGLSQVLNEHFGLVVSLGHRERVTASRFLHRQRQLSERRVSLLRVQGLCQSSQI